MGRKFLKADICIHIADLFSVGGCEAATTSLRSGAEAGRTPCPRGGGQEELPNIRGEGQVAESARLRWRRNGREGLPHV